MYQPVVPGPGLIGWKFLQRTYNVQLADFAETTEVQRDTEYYEANIGKVRSAEDLVSDRRLLIVALGAYGLQGDIDNRYFIRKILEEGTDSEDALANRFTDRRYREMSAAFGFGPGEHLKVGKTDLTAAIVGRYQTNSFEVAAGKLDASLRVALYAQRELAGLAFSDRSNDTKWFTILGDPPLRTLFEKALNLPSSIGQIDIERQLANFKRRAATVFGSHNISQFSAPEELQAVITKFMLREQIEQGNGGMSSGSIALSLLRV